MKKRDVFLLILLLAAGGLLWFFLRPQTTYKESIVRITVDGTVYGEYPLDKNAEISIGDTNVCVIEDGSVYMKSADCPDQICVKTKAIRTSASSIVCLPNKVVVEIVAPDGTKASDDVDVVVH